MQSRTGARPRTWRPKTQGDPLCGHYMPAMPPFALLALLRRILEGGVATSEALRRGGQGTGRVPGAALGGVAAPDGAGLSAR